MAWFATWLNRHRPLTFLFVLCMSLVASLGLTRLTFDTNARNMFRSGDGSMQRLEEAYADFGSDDQDCYVVVVAPDLFEPRAMSFLRDLTSELDALDEVEHASSLTNMHSLLGPATPSDDATPEAWQSFRQKVVSHPLIGERIVSRDGTTAIVLVHLAGQLNTREAMEGPVERVRQRVRSVEAPVGVEVMVTGLPVIRVDMFNTLRREQLVYLVLGSVLGGVIAFVMFRSIAAVLIVTVSACAASLWAFGIQLLLGIPVTPINSVVPTLVLIIAFTDSVHFVHELRRQLSAGSADRDAATEALSRVGIACLLTSVTTAIGFGSLVLTENAVTRQFGLLAACGSLVGFVAVVTIAPLLSGRAWIAERLRASRSCDASLARSRFGRAVIETVLAHRGLVTIVAVVMTISFGLTSLRLTPSTSLREAMPRGSEASRAVRHIDRAMSGILTLLVVVEWDDGLTIADDRVVGALRRVEEAIESESMLGPPLSILRVAETLSIPESPGGALVDVDPVGALALLASAPRDRVGRLLRVDRRRAVVTATMPDVGAHLQVPVLERVERVCRTIDSETSGVSLSMTGNPAAVGHVAAVMIRDLATSLGLASIVIFFVMLAALRSMRLALVSVVPNAFPLLAAGTGLVIVGMPLNVTGVITFCVCLGIAVDDTIHFVIAYRRGIHEGRSAHDAIRDAFLHVGSALLTTTAVLVGGLLALSFSDMPAMQLFGLLASTALVAALAGDLIFLPALLSLFGGHADRSSSDDAPALERAT